MPSFKMTIEAPVLIIILLASLGQCMGPSFDSAINGIGATCNASEPEPCEKNLWLECIESKCVCLNGMINLNESLPCISKIDNECEDTTPNKKECIANAKCAEIGGTKKCQCNEGYLSTPNKEMCLKAYQGSCTNTEECNFYAGLKCRNEECICEQGLWDQKDLKCGSIVGGWCDFRNTTNLPVTCVPNADCIEHTCYCKTNYMETPTHECKLSYGQNCTYPPDSCHPSYKCEGNETVKTCGCDTATQIHDEALQTCINLLGEPCNSMSSPYCVENAICSAGSGSNGKCICDAGFSRVGGNCLKGFEGDCASDHEVCNPESKLECNPDTARCGCITGYEYNPDVKKCFGLSQSNCTVNEDCINLANCNSLKQCECKTGYSLTPNHQCLLSHGQPCEEPRACNTYEFLTCALKGHNCTCESPELVFSPELSSCVSLPEGICHPLPHGDRQLGCVANATCVEGICNCLEGFNVVGNACLEGGSTETILFNSSLGLILAFLVVIYN